MAAGEPDQRDTLSRVLFSLAIVVAMIAAGLGVTGGFTAHILGVRVSAHGPLRPALCALLCAALAFRRLRSSQQDSLVSRSYRIAFHIVPVVVLLAAGTVLALGLSLGTRAAGGSDVYGYASEARLWLAGNLHVRQDFVAAVPWPNADWTFTPLAYRPADDHTILPTYPPGLPLLMALFTKTSGSCGPFAVNPLCGALLVVLAYGLGVRVSGRGTGAIAALSIASSPTVLFMSLWPLSDLPAAAFWTASLLIACRASPLGAAGAGATAGIAIAIRPNLVPLAIFPVIISAWPVRRAPREALRHLLAFGFACLPFVSFIAWLNNYLYDSPFKSGYGDTSAIFHTANLRANLARYPRWLWETQGPLVFLFPLAVLIGRGPRPASAWLRRVLLAFVAGVFACYLWYMPFDAWWYLRFMLPAFPAMFVLAADAVWQGTRRFGPRAQLAAGVVFTFVMMDYGITRGQERAIFDIGAGEQKYADVGRYVTTDLPQNAIVFAMQHSGSVRYYSGRRTIQYQSLDGQWLDRAIEYLRRTGFEPYVVLEGWEIPRFREHFASQRGVTLVDRPPIAVHSRDVFIYATGNAGSNAPRPIPTTTGCQ